MESQSLDVLTNKFTWKIPRFSKLVGAKHYSQTFTVHGRNWRILMYPKGNQTDHLSLFLNVPEAETMQTGWKQTACFTFILVNQWDGVNFKIHGEGASVEFNGRNMERGYRDFFPLGKLHQLSNGYLVDDTVIVEVKFETEIREEHTLTDRKFTWKINNFPSLTAKYYVSPTFEIDGIKWDLQIFPYGNGNGRSFLSLYLRIVNFKALPEGWTIEATYKLRIVNQDDPSKSTITEEKTDFRAGTISWGRQSMISSSKLLDSTAGFVVSNSLIVVADFLLLRIEPLSASFHSHFSSMAKFLSEAESLPSLLDSCSRNRNELVPYIASDQQRSIRRFENALSGLTSDCLSLNLADSRLELLNVQKDRVLNDLRMTLETHRSISTKADELSEREARILRRLGEIDSEKEGHVCEWDVLVVESKEAKRQYEIQVKKVEELERKKIGSEEKVERSISAWAKMKAHFS